MKDQYREAWARREDAWAAQRANHNNHGLRREAIVGEAEKSWNVSTKLAWRDSTKTT